MSRIVFEPPDQYAPGYLRRLQTILGFQDRIKSKQIDAAFIVGMVHFLAEFVTEPADRNEAIEALWDASQAQLLSLFAQLGGGEMSEAPLSENGSASGTGEKATSLP